MVAEEKLELEKLKPGFCGGVERGVKDSGADVVAITGVYNGGGASMALPLPFKSIFVGIGVDG